MIDMKCPACGAGGRVPKDKVNARLVCKKCLKVFHLTSTGNAMLGEPPQTAVTSSEAPRGKVERDFGLDVPPWLGGFARFVFSPKVLAAVGGLILLAGGYIAVSNFRGQSLQGRTEKIARAAVMGDLAALLEMASSDTSAETVEWYVAVRPQCDALRGALLTPTPFVEVVVKKEDSNNGTASVVARINTTDERQTRTGVRIPGATVSSSSPSNSIELPLELTLEGWGGWKLDGKRTFEAIPKKP